MPLCLVQNCSIVCLWCCDALDSSMPLACATLMVLPSLPPLPLLLLLHEYIGLLKDNMLLSIFSSVLIGKLHMHLASIKERKII